jgi:microcystin-dependent protein
LQSGYDNIMPAVPFYITVTPFGQLSTMGNSEIMQVTARTGDTLTVVRGQRGTTAKSFINGDVISNGIYTEDIDEKATKLSIPNGTVPYRQGTGSGEPDSSMLISDDATEGTLAQYGAGGTMTVSSPTDDSHAATKKYVDENSRAKVGDIFISMRNNPAPGRLFMAGGTYNKSSYPDLWQLVYDNAGYGTTTSTTFTLADMRQRMPIGKSSNSPFTTLRNTGGSETVALGNNNMPYSAIMDKQTQTGGWGAQFVNVPSGHYVMGPKGSDATPHENMPPYIVVNYEVVAL